MRPPHEGDLAEVVRLMSKHAPEAFDGETLRREWSAPGVDLDLDARVDDGAYAFVERLDGDRVWLDVHGRPSGELLDWAEGRAGELGARILSGGWSANTPVCEELGRRGFRLVRHSSRMHIDLAEPLDDPVWPQDARLRTFEPGDERVFYDVHQEAFRDSWEPIEEPYDEWAHWLLSPPAFAPDLWFLAHVDGEPAGIAICHPHPSRPRHGWVRVLGVRRPWRKRGLGRALLLHALGEFRRRGFEGAGLGVDAESPTGANELYERVGMRVRARFDIYEKAAR